MNLIPQVTTLSVLLVLYAGEVRSDDELFNTIDAGNQSVVTAILAGDADAVAGGYTDDAYILAPDAATVRGREDIRAFWQGVIDSGVTNVRIGTGEVASSGDLAYALGTLEVTGADGATAHSRYVLVFRRESGEWRLHIDAWTPSM
jgi:uncharacterized protein (TIGR02246 family)